MNLATSTLGPHSSRTTQKGPVLVFGSPAPWALSQMSQAAEAARLSICHEPTSREVDRWLEQHHPSAIVVDAQGSAAEQACLHLRYNPLLANVPIVGLVDEVSDLAFEEMYGWGADDIAVRGDQEMLARRLRQIASAGEIPLSRRRGLAVVADTDRRRRVLTARVLRNAGYGVTFALDAEEAIREASHESVELVVSASSLETATSETLAARARKAGVKAAWVVAASPKEASRIQSATAGLAQVAVYDAFGPPENVLFVANELTRRAAPDARASARVLFGTTVHFRTAGGEQEEKGYSYNISAGGLYIRTLAPLARATDAWLELRPPRSDRRVRLEAKVVWARGFGPNDAATVPPGFGVQISGGSMGDLERYSRGYRAFAAEISG